MQTSKNCLLDVNCWLAAAARRHRHHPEAKSWLEAAGSPLAFCRVTQMGFLRLVTNAKVMGADVLSPAEAWAAYQKFLADPRVVFAAEPFELENEWRQITGLPNFKPNSWTDSYLAAFARAGGYRVVTFDNGFENYSGLDVIILLPAAELGKISRVFSRPSNSLRSEQIACELKMNEVPQNNLTSQKTARRFPWAWISLVAMLCIPVFFASSFLLMPGRAIREADQGYRKAKQTIDPEELRSWALETIKRWPSTNGSRVIANSEIPESIRVLYSQPPGKVFVRSDVVEIDWGGALFHWGFEIGSTNFFRPFNSGNHECPFNFEWKPGIYYSREANWKLQ